MDLKLSPLQTPQTPLATQTTQTPVTPGSTVPTDLSSTSELLNVLTELQKQEVQGLTSAAINQADYATRKQLLAAGWPAPAA